MPLHELMGWPGPMTARQFRAWRAWLEMQWNLPDRGDFYAMQIAAAHGVKDPYIKFPERRAERREWPAREQRWASTTDDASGWWAPHPLTEAELADMHKRRRA